MKKMQRFDQINVIPFIDIMLVLLVMVLTTATFIKSGVIPVELPESQTKQLKEQQDDEVNIVINKKGMIFINKIQIEASQLEAELRKISKKQTVVLSSDKDAAFHHFVHVMDILKKLHHEQLYIVTQKSTQ
ncbi:MAG: TonB system transport protein ExbD [Sulfurimonas sp.]|nr:MAG: TonB system transport protein ExbD [Sulfurimonas sp.]